MPPPFQWLVITDGTKDDAGHRNQVDLLSPSGFCLLEEGDWQPAVTQPKGGGVWKDSQLSDGRRPADFKYQNVIETMTLTISAQDQDQLIRDTQELRRLLTKARTYGTTSWQDTPVWIEAQSPGETKMRHAVIWDWSTPNDGNPYEEPFWQTIARAGMDDFTLTLERKPFWTSNTPGEGTATQVSGQGSYCTVTPLLFDGVDDNVDCGSPAGLDDLPDFAVAGKGVVVVDGWIKADGYGEVNAGIIIAKRTGGIGWFLRVDAAAGLAALIDCVAQDAISTPGLDEFTADSVWHYVLMAYDETGGITPAARTIYLAIDGTWVVSYPTQQVSAGNYNSDAAQNLEIGSLAGAQTFDGDIGWIRVRDALPTGVVVGVNFTAPERCARPDVDANTQGQYIYEGTGGTTGNEGAAGGVGTITGAIWDADECCSLIYGRTATTLDEVYLTNKQNRANISHIFTWSAANGFSANLMNAALPYDLIDIVGAAPAVNDYVAFGIDTTLLDSGPFCSLVFDIGTALSGMTLVWEYWNGAWVGLAPLFVHDNTNQAGAGGGTALDTTGVRSAHWEQPSDWATVAINGITGYWVRLRVTAAPGPHVAPTQQNRDVYSVTWASVFIDDSDVIGDMGNLLRCLVHTQSDGTPGGGATDRATHRIWMGLRTADRGEDFSAFINIADEQNPTGITVTTPGIVTSFVNDVTTPTGRRALYNPVGVVALARQITVTFDITAGLQYYGKYHAFLRYRQSGGTAGDVEGRLAFRDGAGFIRQYTDTLPTTNLLAWQFWDFGQVTLPPSADLIGGTDAFTTYTIDVELSSDPAAADPDLYVYDLFLLPVDEYALEVIAGGQGNLTFGDGALIYNRYADIDGLTIPKVPIRVSVKEVSNDNVRLFWRPIGPAPPKLQSNEDQRLWYLSVVFGNASGSIQYSNPYIAHTVRAYTSALYWSMRGDR